MIPHESGVWGNGILDARDRTGQFVLELLAHDGDQPLLQILGAAPELDSGLLALAWQDEEPETGNQTRGQDSRHVNRDRACGGHNERAQPNGAGLGHSHLGHGAPHAE